MIFEKIVFEIQKNKLLKSAIDKKTSVDVLKTYIINNIHRTDLNTHDLSNLVRTSSDKN
jgi:hypothetical protein